jgi:hypothetical protein
LFGGFHENLSKKTPKLIKMEQKGGYQVHKTERKINHLLNMNDLKFLVRYEELENEIKIVKAIGIDINMNFVLKGV